MKALTGSCSKAIIETLGSLSPRVALRVSDGPEFCFSLRSRNDKKGCNLWLLKLVQSKGIYPVHAVPPKDQVDLETAEPQAQQSEQTNESKFVRVAFQLQKNCNFGEQFHVVGNDPMLGSWDPIDALPMTWSEGHVWTVEVDMPAGKSIQFKFILKGKGGNIIWQPGSDRMIQTWETINRIIVCEDWENAELQKIIEEPQHDQLQRIIEESQGDQLQKIIEEDQLAQPNEELQVDSQVSSFTEILGNPQEDLDSNASEISGIKDTQNHAEEKPLTEPVLQQVTGDSISSSMEKPMAIVAENISYSEDLIWSTGHKRNKKNMLQTSEESADSLGNDDIMPDFGHSGSAASLKNQERTIVESSLFDFEGGPVLVPGLIIPPTVPTDEASQGEVQEMTTVDTSVGAFESQDQNIPEFSMEQETDDVTPQEINATINNEPELLYNEHEEPHLSPEMEDRPNYEPVDDFSVLDLLYAMSIGHRIEPLWSADTIVEAAWYSELLCA
ncbi:Cyclomaltodextrin glucanotransferase [Spatholobus suberectus]|nr:Cyclomaltodextrin glucanotransferase [Spatholobus suberectus]